MEKVKELLLQGHTPYYIGAALVVCLALYVVIRRFLMREVRATELRAVTGDVEAQVWMGRAYHHGLYRLRRNYKKAAKWYGLAANAGDFMALNGLGTLYTRGLGVKADLNQAVKLFTQAADQGDPAAQVNLSRLYYDGRGIKRDDGMAYFWALVASQRAGKEGPAVEGGYHTKSFPVFLESAKKRLMPEKVVEVQKQAAEWKPAGKTPVEKTKGAA